MIKQYSKRSSFIPGKVDEAIETFCAGVLHLPTWYVFEGNLKNLKDLEEYTGIIADMIKNAKEFVHVCDTGEEPFIVTDNAVLIERRYPV